MKNYGFIAPVITPDNFVLGASNSLVKVVLQSDGQWDAYLPEKEFQNLNYIETYNCTSFGTCNVVEMLFKKIYGENYNFSDRYLGIKAGTKPPGNDPHIVAQAVRHDGLIQEIFLPFKDINSWQEYYSYKGGNKSTCEQEGKFFLKKWEVGHEWVSQNNPTPEMLMESLRYSPLGISVSAWYQNGDLFVDNGEPNNHWCVLYGYKKGEYWKVFDSYDLSTKRLAWDFKFQYAKRYSIMVSVEKQYNNILSKLLDILKNYVAILNKNIGGMVENIFSKTN
jgi:hypothetical protein